MNPENYSLDDFEPVDENQSSDVGGFQHARNALEKHGKGLSTAFARGAEGAIGLPADIANLGIDVANLASNKIIGSDIPGSRKVQEYLPGSENIRKAGKYLFGKEFEPENGEDSFWDKVSGDFGTYISPVGGATKIGTAITRALAGNVAAEGAKSVGFGETGQALAKLTTNMLSMFPGSSRFFNNKSNQAYEAAEKSLTPNSKVLAKDLEKDLLNFEKEFVFKGDSTTPAKEFLKKRVNAIGNKISGNTIPVQEVWELKKDFNQLWKNGEVPQEAKYAFGNLIDKLGDTLKEYGQYNKAFGENFNIAEDIFKGFRRMDKVSSLIVRNTNLSKLLKKGIKSPTAAGLLGGLTHFAPGGVIAKAGLGSTAFGAGQVVKYGNFIKNSKEARKTYGEIIKNAAAGDAVNTAKSIKQFDKIAQHYDDKYSDFEPIDEFSEFESV